MATILNSGLYPPLIDTFLSFSFEENFKNCKIYFKIPSTMASDEINLNLVHLIVREQNTNKNILNNKYSNEIKLTKAEQEQENLFFVRLYNSDLKEGFQLNTYYKIQLRFSQKNIPLPEEYSDIEQSSFILDTGEEAPQFNPSANWLIDNVNYFSEWSTVCLVRRIAKPDLQVVSTNADVLTSFAFVGKLTFLDEEKIQNGKVVVIKETDNLKSYQIQVVDSYNEKIILEDSGIIFVELSKNQREINYSFLYDFTKEKNYIIKVYITTTSNFSYQENFILRLPAQSMEDFITVNSFTIETNQEEGYFEIQLDLKYTEDVEKIILKRSSVQKDFSYWEEICNFSSTETYSLKEIWKDFYIEQGVWYKYAIQLLYKNGIYSDLFFPNEDKMYLNFFENIFLNNQTQQLKIKFNPQISSFKKNVSETKADTIGSQYTYIRRNGNMDYRQFSLSGLISYQEDENNIFISKEKLFHNQLGQELFETNEDKNGKEIIKERLFREAVYKFLYDGKIKLYRSPTEGNILVKLMDINLTPEQTLGRLIYSFSCTAYEVDEFSLENLQKYNLIQDKQFIDTKKEYQKIENKRKNAIFTNTAYILDVITNIVYVNLQEVENNV